MGSKPIQFVQQSVLVESAQQWKVLGSSSQTSTKHPRRTHAELSRRVTTSLTAWSTERMRPMSDALQSSRWTDSSDATREVRFKPVSIACVQQFFFGCLSPGWSWGPGKGLWRGYPSRMPSWLVPWCLHQGHLFANSQPIRHPRIERRRSGEKNEHRNSCSF